MKKKKKIFIVVIIIGIVLILVGIYINSLINPRKPGRFDKSIFERNSKSVTIYESGEELIEYKWFKRKKIAQLGDSLFNNFTGEEDNIHLSEGDKVDEEKYTVLFDFNNDIAKIYVNKEDKTAYIFRLKNGYKRQLSDKEYDELMSYVKKEE